MSGTINLNDVQNTVDRLTALAHAAVSVGLYAADRDEKQNRRTLERLDQMIAQTAADLAEDIEFIGKGQPS